MWSSTTEPMSEQQQSDVPSPAQAEAPTDAHSRLKGILTLVAAVVTSLLIIFLVTYFREDLRQLGHAGYLGLFIVSIIGNATVVIPAPVYVMSCAAGLIYGPVQVGLVSGFGAALGELTGYFAGYGGAAIIPTGKWYRRLEQFMRKHGMLAIFLLAVIPNPLFDVGGIIAGALRMKVWQFLIAATLGKALRLGIMAYVCLGGLPILRELLHF